MGEPSAPSVMRMRDPHARSCSPSLHVAMSFTNSGASSLQSSLSSVWLMQESCVTVWGRLIGMGNARRRLEPVSSRHNRGKCYNGLMLFGNFSLYTHFS